MADLWKIAFVLDNVSVGKDLLLKYTVKLRDCELPRVTKFSNLLKQLSLKIFILTIGNTPPPHSIKHILSIYPF